MFVRRFAAIAAVLLLAASARAETQHTTDSLDKVKQQIDDEKAVLVDVRETKEWDAGHCEGAELVPLSELAKKSKDADYRTELEKKLPKSKVVYCHCAKGGRALLAADLFRDLGYDVRPLKPGYKDLINAGFEQAPTDKKSAE